MRAEKKGWAALQPEAHFTTVFCNTISSVSRVYNTSGRGQRVSDSREIRHRRAHNWNPPWEQTRIRWQAARWRPGAKSVTSCHEIKQCRDRRPVWVRSPTWWIQAIDVSQIYHCSFQKPSMTFQNLHVYSTICNIYMNIDSFKGILKCTFK